MSYCPQCGTEILEGRFCANCGLDITSYLVSPEEIQPPPAPIPAPPREIPVPPQDEDATVPISPENEAAGAASQPQPVSPETVPEVLFPDPAVPPAPESAIPPEAEAPASFDSSPAPDPAATEPAPSPASYPPPNPQPPYPQQPYQAPPYYQAPDSQSGGYYQAPGNQSGYYGNYQAPTSYQPTRVGPSIMEVYTRALSLLMKKPIRLWGLSLMHTLLNGLASLLGVLPIITLPIQFTLNVGMAAIYRDGLREKAVNSDQLFLGFHDFFRTAGGMAWRALWILIWSLVPVVGFILCIIKSYAYRFVPYILLDHPDVSATEALRKSMRMTNGMKLQMFGADALVIVAFILAEIILALLGQIPYLGVLFILVAVILMILGILLLPLFFGLVEASFFEGCPNKE